MLSGLPVVSFVCSVENLVCPSCDCMCRDCVLIEDRSELWTKLSQKLLHLSTEMRLCEEIDVSTYTRLHACLISIGSQFNEL